MNRAQLVVVLIVLLVVGFASPVSAQVQDEAAIRQVQERQADAWNRHDATAYANLFTDDGDVVNVVGWWWRGRSEIKSKLDSAFAFMFRDSTLTITDVQVRFLSPAVAIAHVTWTMVGAKTPPGIPEPRVGIQLQVLTKAAGGWMIASFQNTNSVPEVAFPLAVREWKPIGQPLSAVAPPTEPDAITPPVVNALPPPEPAIRRDLVRIAGKDPDYPSAALQAGITGKVVAHLRIDEMGNVSEVIIKSAEPSGHFDQAVIDALKQWKFRGDGKKYVFEVSNEFAFK